MGDNNTMSALNPRSHVAEAYRILRTNLQFSTADNSLRTLLVTSPGPSEGKSTTAANLSIVMAQTGARVVLLDCDLRWGEQHQLFELPNETGLSNVLMGSMGISQAPKNTRIPNLKVVTCGPLPPNPAELLGSEKAKEILVELAEMADFIVIDAPPTLMVADAAILSSIVDGCILVIKAAKTKKDDLKQAKECLEKANARIVGTVLNAVASLDGSYYYNSYYSGKKNRKETAAAKV